MRKPAIWLLALVAAMVITIAIMFIRQNTLDTENKYDTQVKQLETKDKQSEDSQIQNLNKQIKLLNSKLQAKAAAKLQAGVIAEASKTTPSTVITLPVASTQPTAPIVSLVPVVSDYKILIYNAESGNNPAAINRSSGACGLGQAEPCSKMPCSLSDYACQDAYFTNYMLSRYGSWAAAWAFHLLHGWW